MAAGKKSMPESAGFSEEERAAMRERAAELKAEAGRGRGAAKVAADEEKTLAAIAKMAPSDRAVAERVHFIVTSTAPQLKAKLWYGQPAYAKDGKVVCFFRSGDKDGERYSAFGFNPVANLDDDSGMWPTAYALTELTDAAEKNLKKLVERAVS